MIVACIALFVAMGGTTIAAVKLKANSVKTKNVKDGAITGPKIGPGAVTGDKFAPGAVGSGAIGDGSITGAKVANGAIGATKIAGGAVGSAQIADGGVGKAEVAASGFASNTTGVTLDSGQCTTMGFDASGVRPGDVVAFNLGATPNDLTTARVIDETVQFPDVMFLFICNDSGTNDVFYDVGSVTIGYFALR